MLITLIHRDSVDLVLKAMLEKTVFLKKDVQ